MSRNSSDIKKIDAKEFRALGLVQEVNRRFLHPMGLALEVIVEEDGSTRFGDVWDERDDPEGWRFAEGEIEIEKVRSVDALLEAKRASRLAALGYVIQPVHARTFHCAGACWRMDCDCNLHDQQDVPPAPMPPLHEGCGCYVVEESDDPEDDLR